MSNIPQITFAPDYFRKTVRNESLYPLVWRVTKEVMQNSRDAGASVLQIRCNSSEKSIEFSDNAGGMDRDTLLNVFLALGGSKKDKQVEGGVIGGFGDAKKVILLCWDKWEVKTQDSYLNNTMIGKTPIKKLDYYIDGTIIKIWVDDEYSIRDIVNYISTCQLDTMDIKLYEDGNEITTTKLYRRRLTRELSFGDLYINKSNPSQLFVVRINGLTLFYKYINGATATAILELDNVYEPKSNKYILNVTRESLKWEYQTIIENIIDEIASDPVKAMKPKKSERIEKFQGLGKIKTVTPNSEGSSVVKVSTVIEKMMEDDRVAFVDAVEKLGVDGDDILNSNKVIKLKDGESVDDVIKSISEKYSLEELVEIAVSKDSNLVISNNSESQKLEFEITDGDKNELSNVFPYDFIVKGCTKVNYNSVKYQKLLLAWHKTIEYVCYYNNVNGSMVDLGEYAIGFIFDDEVKAQHLRMEGDEYFLLNPSNLNKSVYGWRGLVLELLTRAVHEITHTFVENHDGNFVVKEAQLREICFWYIDDFFSVIGGIIKGNEETFVKNAMLDEIYSFDE